MPPLNTCEEQVDSYYPLEDSRANSPFDDEGDDDFLEEDLEEAIKGEQDEASPDNKPDRSLFLNFNADLNPQNTNKKPKAKKATTYKVNGVNILNRKSLDSKTVMERLKRRRENHNSVERKRRDNINHTILEISQLIPHETASTKLNKGSILRLAADYIKEVQAENKRLVAELERYKADTRAHPSDERIGYPMRPYTQLLHDQPSYPVHPRAVHGNSQFVPTKAGPGYHSSIGTSPAETASRYPGSQPPHQSLLSNPQVPVFPSQPVSHHQSHALNSPHGHLPSTNAQHHIQSTSVPDQVYPPSSLPSSHVRHNSITSQPYPSHPLYGYNQPSPTTAVQNMLPPLYKSTQPQRKGMMFNEFSGTLNLF
ncbi:HLH-domain-containing protein [Basidiobolus meristosporus CBS 931.73]|uniref:HLH-domain-containing protein n=1 Tax=Basidiobolus meristosporus CBS 931.73 TaxID=1314790 RepID=A0A1Y1Y964_9FUNG|nr:HLH-domain-containing protein [Basidiobolus meristosporus CBS 931.73]|eukprot:ORX94559.1 HLH-domain-containing protein [Basidiobolus meristosporus CBS 931.73]